MIFSWGSLVNMAEIQQAAWRQVAAEDGREPFVLDSAALEMQEAQVARQVPIFDAQPLVGFWQEELSPKGAETTQEIWHKLS